MFPCSIRFGPKYGSFIPGKNIDGHGTRFGFSTLLEDQMPLRAPSGSSGYQTVLREGAQAYAMKPPRARTRTPVRRITPDPCCNHQSMIARACPMASRPVRAVVIPAIKMTDYPEGIIRIHSPTASAREDDQIAGGSFNPLSSRFWAVAAFRTAADWSTVGCAIASYLVRSASLP